jgi:hypothetical protein
MPSAEERKYYLMVNGLGIILMINRRTSRPR